MRDHSIALMIVGASLALPGCYETQELHHDGGLRFPDGALIGSDCLVGGHPRCDCVSRCPDGTLCRFGVCLSEVDITEAGDYRQLDCATRVIGTELPLRGPAGYGCYNGEACFTDGRGTEYEGVCVEGAVCDDARAAGLDAVCRWTDGTDREVGPPASDTCPLSPRGDLPFCGGACGACPIYPASSHPSRGPACIGVSDARAHGLCAVYQLLCDQTHPVSDLCTPLGMFDEPQTCACLMFRSADGELSPLGWAVPEASCRAYRGLYSGEVECFGPDNEPLR